MGRRIKMQGRGGEDRVVRMGGFGGGARGRSLGKVCEGRPRIKRGWRG
jgi:hypothetical protein